jgi:glycosyltransferase involved in cell wall biosynthesis
MIVLFDLYEISLGKGKSIGIYNYAMAVLKTLAKETDKLSIIVVCSGENEKEIKNIPNIQIIKLNQIFPNFRQRFIWRYLNALRLAKKINADIYYSPKGFAPSIFKRKRKPFIVLTIHDMIPFYYKENFPGYFNFFEDYFVTTTLKHSAKIANEIITISDFSKQMIENYAKTNSEIRVIYNGIEIKNKRENLIKPEPYIFAITSKLPHKNKENIIKGYIEYRNISNKPLPLKICGITSEELVIPKDSFYEIECIAFADEDKFSTLFSNATLFLFLPFIEGFGFPPLEAAMYSVPSVVSDISVLREILGQSAYFVNPSNPKNIAEGINIVLSDQKIKEEILLHGKETITKYVWDDCCSQIMEVFEKTIRP